MRARSTALTIASILAASLTACSGGPTSAACGNGTPINEARMSVFALEVATGSVRWSRDDLPPYANGYTHIDGTYVVVSHGLTGESFDLATGMTGPVPPGTVPVPVTVGARQLDATLPAGVQTAALWDTAVVSGADAVVINDIGDGNGELVGFDPVTTTKRWTFPLNRATHSNLLLQNGLVVVTTADSTPSCG